MSLSYNVSPVPSVSASPLVDLGVPTRVLAWRYGEPVHVAQFLAQVRAVAAGLPDAAAVNLCEDRYAFLVAFCAIVLRGHANLLPPSRAARAVTEVMAAHPGCYALGDSPAPPGLSAYHRLPALDSLTPRVADMAVPVVPGAQIAVEVYTSGSSGRPRAHAKTWASLRASTRGNLERLQATIGAPFQVIATMPPQHTFGLEMSILLPLLGDVAVHASRPFFPADVAAALAQVPSPRLLVTTPTHLRALIEAGVNLPPVAATLSATAPLPLELAGATEARTGAPVLEVFGASETCAFASRRVTRDEHWSLYDGVQLHPQPDGTLVEAPQLTRPTLLADLFVLHDDGRRFMLRGRHADLLEIAGKRASLGDLTRRLLAIPGVHDGVVFQLDRTDTMGVRRLAALVVAPELDERAIYAALRLSIDAVFLPRPLKRVAALPRNETGKLPRAALLALLGRDDASAPS